MKRFVYFALSAFFIAAGGTLELYMGPEPNRQWGIDRPPER